MCTHRPCWFWINVYRHALKDSYILWETVRPELFSLNCPNFWKIIIVKFAYGYCIMFLWMGYHHLSEGGGKPGRKYSDREKLLITFTVKICYQSLNQLPSTPSHILIKINLFKYKITHLFIKESIHEMKHLNVTSKVSITGLNCPAKIAQST